MPAYLLIHTSETKPKCELEHYINAIFAQSSPDLMLLQICMPVHAALDSCKSQLLA